MNYCDSLDKVDEVAVFLESMGLGKYLQVFKENGFDEMDIVMEIQTKHLVEMKIPAGHQIKITKRIQALKNQDPETQNKMLQENTKFNATVSGTKNKEESNTPRVSSAQPSSRGVNTEEASNNLIDQVNKLQAGERNIESASTKKRVRFSEAPVEEQTFRKTGPILKSQNKPSTPRQKVEVQAQPEKKAPKTSTTECQAEGVGTSPKSIRKASCWLCFKLVCEDDIIQNNNKQFCSQRCLDNYKATNSVLSLAIFCNQIDSMCKRDVQENCPQGGEYLDLWEVVL
mgnify:CR=1 FL=1